MIPVRFSIIVLAGLSLPHCATVREYLGAETSLYCDNFMVYDMCVRDLDRDGVADFIYFSDSREVFLSREEALAELPADLGVHRCMQFMDAELVATTSRMLLIDEETPLLERTDIRGALLLRYMGLMPAITECQLSRQGEANGSEADI